MLSTLNNVPRRPVLAVAGRRSCCTTRSVRVRVWTADERRWIIWLRNADGDELLFVHQGAGELFCDFGHLSFAAAITS